MNGGVRDSRFWGTCVVWACCLVSSAQAGWVQRSYHLSDDPPPPSTVDPTDPERERRLELWTGFSSGLQLLRLSNWGYFSAPSSGFRRAFLSERIRQEFERNSNQRPSALAWRVGLSVDRMQRGTAAAPVEETATRLTVGLSYRPQNRVEVGFSTSIGMIPEQSISFGNFEARLGYTFLLPPTQAQEFAEDDREPYVDDEPESQEGGGDSVVSRAEESRSEIIDEEVDEAEVRAGAVRNAIDAALKVGSTGVLPASVGASGAVRGNFVGFEVRYRPQAAWMVFGSATLTSFATAAGSVFAVLDPTAGAALFTTAININGFGSIKWLSEELTATALVGGGRWDFDPLWRLEGDLCYRTYNGGVIAPTFSINPAISYALGARWRVGAKLEAIIGDFGLAPVGLLSARFVF